MSDPGCCRECGAVLVSGDPLGGQCPRCLLELARAATGRLAPGRSGTSARRFGDFLLVRRIGAGPLGEVHEALERSTSRHLALKMWDAASVPEDKGPGGRRPWPAAALRHPGIVPVFSHGRRGDTRYVAMELMRDGSLRQWIDRSERGGTTLPAERLTRVWADTADALQYAHDQGIVHGGIQPGNLFFGEGGRRLLLGDFEPVNGSALRAISWVDDPAGSARHVAPEQMREPDGASPRGDVYSLAACLREALAPGVPAGLAALLARCLAVNPSDRPASAGGMGRALRESIEGR